MDDIIQRRALETIEQREATRHPARHRITRALREPMTVSDLAREPAHEQGQRRPPRRPARTATDGEEPVVLVCDDLYVQQREHRAPSIVLVWWLLRSYITFAVCFVLGGGYIALVGADGGLSEAGGTVSVVSGWLLWGMLMVPIVGVWALLLGIVAWLFLRRRQPSVWAAAVVTGALAAVAAIAVSVWFSGLYDVDPLALAALGAVVWVAVGALSARDASRVLRVTGPNSLPIRATRA